MKKNSSIISALLIATVLYSCNTDKNDDQVDDIAVSDSISLNNPFTNGISTDTTNNATAVATGANAANQSSTSQQTQTPTSTAQPTATTQAQTATKPGMNPPHGQAGHRCEIPVGAPLNTPAPAKNAPKTSTATSPTNPKPAAVTNTENHGTPAPQPPKMTTAPGFSGKPNPKHGQEGHRCDIPDGAILP